MDSLPYAADRALKAPCADRGGALWFAHGLPLLLVLVCPMTTSAVSPHHAVQQGNALYQEGKYPEAAAQYGAAAQALPAAAEIHFNQGNAAYKQGDYQQALDHYAKALPLADRTLEGKLKYNLGNVAYQQALQQLQKPQEATTHLRSAMTYYRDSLDVDPQQAEARYNLELSQMLLQKLQQQQQQQQSQQPGEKPPQDGQQPQQQPGEQQPQHAQEPQQAQTSQPPHDGQPQAPPGQAPPPEPQQPGASQQAQAGQPQEPPQPAAQADSQAPEQDNAAQHALRPEEAARLLEAIRERGREADAQRQQRRAATGASKVEKDW